MYITCSLNGRLGNYFFIVISTWAYAKANNLEFIMNKSFEQDKYYKIFFSNIKTQNLSVINFTGVEFGVYENCSIHKYIPDKNLLFYGFLQNANNFNMYREEVLSTFFNIKNTCESNNNFFIHIRLGDFMESPLHYINLDKYYTKAIEYLKNKMCVEDMNIYIISDDITNAMKKNYLKLLPQKNLTYLDNKMYNEAKTFEIFKNCYLGGIIGNSTFAWWGAYVINNPNKLVITPNKYINTQDDFSGLYMDYVVMEV